MSRTKQFVFDRLAADEPRREAMRLELQSVRARLTVRIPTRRRSRRGAGHWDPLWPSMLSKAGSDLGIEMIRVNDGIFVATEQQATELVSRAEELMAERLPG